MSAVKKLVFRLRVWKEWVKGDHHCWVTKVGVLLGFVKSPTFDWLCGFERFQMRYRDSI